VDSDAGWPPWIKKLSHWAVTETSTVIEKIDHAGGRAREQYLAVRDGLSVNPYRGTKPGPPLGRDLWVALPPKNLSKTWIPMTIYYQFDEIELHILDVRIHGHNEPRKS
jgi:hypothetical protein